MDFQTHLHLARQQLKGGVSHEYYLNFFEKVSMQYQLEMFKGASFLYCAADGRTYI
jgi:hypothetical protein